MKDLQTEEVFDGRFAVDVYKLRSIKPSPRAIAECSIYRKKYLQISRLRAMRAVLCDVLENAALLTDQVAGRGSVIQRRAPRHWRCGRLPPRAQRRPRSPAHPSVRRSSPRSA